MERRVRVTLNTEMRHIWGAESLHGSAPGYSHGTDNMRARTDTLLYLSSTISECDKSSLGIRTITSCVKKGNYRNNDPSILHYAFSLGSTGYPAQCKYNAHQTQIIQTMKFYCIWAPIKMLCTFFLKTLWAC